MDITHATPELFDALAKAQSEIHNASKNASNPHFRSKYADLAEVLTTIRESFPKNGLSLVQSPSFDGAMANVTTLVAHAKGGYITAQASCVPAKSDAQGIGAATTYLRRYSAASLAGIAQEDDDGNAAKHDRAPVAADHEGADVSDWISAITAAVDATGLDALAKDIAASELSASSKLKLRAAFSAQKSVLAKAAAA